VLLRKKHINTILSFIIIGCWTAIMFLMSYPGHGHLTNMFGVLVYCILTLFVGVLIGIIALLIRLFTSFNLQGNFLYDFCGSLNFCLGMLGVFLLISGNPPDLLFILLFALSLILGVFILSDIYPSETSARQE
jgi:hypothetical protein